MNNSKPTIKSRMDHILELVKLMLDRTGTFCKTCKTTCKCLTTRK